MKINQGCGVVRGGVGAVDHRRDHRILWQRCLNFTLGSKSYKLQLMSETHTSYFHFLSRQDGFPTWSNHIKRHIYCVMWLFIAYIIISHITVCNSGLFTECGFGVSRVAGQAAAAGLHQFMCVSSYQGFRRKSMSNTDVLWLLHTTALLYSG